MSGRRLDPRSAEPAYDVIRRFVDAGRIPGAVCAVGSSTGALPPFAYGVAGWEPVQAAARPDTIYDCASLTKVVVTATLALRFVEAGLLHLDEPVCRHVPEFVEGAGGSAGAGASPTTGRSPGSGTNSAPDAGPGSGARPEPAQDLSAARARVTVRHLLTHTSGLPAWRPLYEAGTGRAPVLSALCATPLERPPGTAVRYSCLGFILLGEILTRLGGAGLDQLAAEMVFGPLGMADSMYCPPPALLPRIAPTERVDGRVLHGVVHDENARALEGVSGNAGLFSTAGDLARFAQMLLSRGGNGPRLLSARAVAAATRCYTESLGGERRGLGWLLKGEAGGPAGDLFGPASFGHTGFTGTSIWIDPEADLFAVLLTNRVHPTRANDAHLELRPRFHNALAAALS